MTISESYKKVRADTEAMCEPLLIEDYIPQPIIIVSPPKWSLGHTSWFFEQFILIPNKKGYKKFHPLYNYLFNSYYEGAGKRINRDTRGHFSRPSVDEVYKYRAHVDQHMQEYLEGNLSQEIRELVKLGMNHEQQHQELFYTDLKYTFSLNPLFPIYGETPFCELGRAGIEAFIFIEEGMYEIGHKGEEFAFDNELPAHKVHLQSFEIADILVSNKDYIEFIRDDGYRKHEHWLEEGWFWVKTNEIEKPMYWHSRENEWQQYTLAGLRPVQDQHPVSHLNYYEAYAFADWKGMRLPTEFEWEAASDKFHWGDRWEWTESAYLPYPGFAKAEGTVGEYNGKFMVNQMVLRGSSPVTPEGHSRKTYRNFFHPHSGWQFTGLRLARK